MVTPIPWDRLDRTVPDQWSIRDVDQAQGVELPPSQQLDHGRITDAALEVGVDLETRFDRFGRKREGNR